MSDVSVLFALDAEELLEKGMTSDAIELCKSGIAAYPDYFAGYALLIKALLENKMHEDALIYIELADSIFPHKPAILDFRNEIENLSQTPTSDPLAIDDDVSLLVMTDDDLDIVPQRKETTDAQQKEINHASIYTLLHQDDDFEQIDDISVNEDVKVGLDDENVELIDNDIFDEDTSEIFESAYVNNDQDITGSLDIIDVENEPEVESENPNNSNEFALNDLISMIDSDNAIQPENSHKFSELLASIGDSSIDDIIALSSEISDSDPNDEPAKSLKKGFLKQLATIDIGIPEIDYQICANDKEIIAGLYDYRVSEQHSSSKLRYDAIASAGFDIKSIEEKYSKKATNKDDFAILAEKIKLIDIKPVERSFDEPYDDEFYGDENEFVAVAPATETMANIFVLQQAYPKAERIYRQLIESNPDKADYYLQKIDSFKDKYASEDS